MKSLVVFTILLAGVSHAEDLPGDIDDDGVVSFNDFLILSQNFGRRRQTVSNASSSTTAIREQNGLPERYHGWWGLERAEDWLDGFGDVDLVGDRFGNCCPATP